MGPAWQAVSRMSNLFTLLQVHREMPSASLGFIKHLYFGTADACGIHMDVHTIASLPVGALRDWANIAGMPDPSTLVLALTALVIIFVQRARANRKRRK
jgi:hypothetical protein